MRRSDPIFVLFFLSGFSGLIYESVWSHYVKLFLGSAAYAQTLVLVVFVGGLALGAWLCARIAERLRNPLRLYAIVEAVIGLFALAFHSVFVAAVDWGYATLLPAACDPGASFCAAQWLLSAALLAPQSILLGATFPLVCSAALRLGPDQPGHDIAALYFLNSLGAVLGVLASAFTLIPAVGLPGTLVTAGIVNLAIATAAYLLSKAPPPRLSVEPVVPVAGESAESVRRVTRFLLATSFLTGLSSFIYEIVWIRMLSLVLGASTHSFEIMLASFILGLALGGLWIRNRVDQSADPVRLLGLVQLVMGVAAVATIPVYNGAFDLMAWILYALAHNDAGFLLFNLSSTAIALLVMLPATFCAGMTLPLITYRLLRSSTGERALGLVYAVNTLGAILGVVIAVHFLLEWLGLRGALVVGAAIDVGLGVALLALARRGATARMTFLRPAVAGVLALAILATAFDVDPRRSSSGVFRTGAARLSPEESIIFHRDGKTATVDVVNFEGRHSIRTNGKPDAAVTMVADKAPTGDEYTMALLGLLPLGHRPDARTAAVIGFGSGMSTTMLLGSPRLQRVDSIEIEPAMVEGARNFLPKVAPAFGDPRSHIVIDDAKSYFARGGGHYDIIVSEPSNPWVSGVASLFTEEFYARLARHLNEGGVLSQWLHTYEMDTPTLASIIQAVSKTFPQFVIYTSIDADIILVARKGGAPGRFDPAALGFAGLRPALERLKLTDVDVVRRRLVASSDSLSPLFRSYGVPANSDFFPIVDQRASRTRFTRARVNELLELQASPIPLLEMLGGASRPPPGRQDSMLVVFAESIVADAWRLHDIVLGSGPPRPAAGDTGMRELSARLVRSWMVDCRKGEDFDRILPSFVNVAEVLNPHLDPDAAMQVWRALGDSPCAKTLTPPQKRWLELFRDVARRDAAAMASHGAEILEASRGTKSPLGEYAFLATVTALTCEGQVARARALINATDRNWVRDGTHQAEMRFLVAMTDPAAAQARGGRMCAPPGGS